MRVVELWRYPVKSMQGERLDVAAVGASGIVGDRQWAVIDLGTGFALTARREPRLLFASARVDENTGSGVAVTLPDGSVAASDDDLSRWLERAVSLRPSGDPGTFEIAADFEDEAGSPWMQWNGPAGSFHDSSRIQVSLLSTGSLGAWDRRRFRANVVVDGPDRCEDEFVGQSVGVGACVVEVVKSIDRCVMTTRAQPGGIARDLAVLRTINAERATLLGVGGLVAVAGSVAVGDEVTPLGTD